MPDSQPPSTIDVAAVWSAPGRSPATGPSRLHVAAGRIVSIEPLSGRGTGLAMAAPSNAHDHGRGLRTLAFGAGDDTLEAWIQSLAREPVVSAYHRAAVAFARMAEGGIAATNHSHGMQDEAAFAQETAAVSRAARDIGIRVAFAAPFTDRNPFSYGAPEQFMAAADPSIRAELAARMQPSRSAADYLRLVDDMAAFEHDGFSLQYCPVGPQWVSDASLTAIAEASARTGRRVHMHLLETRYQREWADYAYPSGFLAHLDAIGLLSPRLSVAHGVFLRADDCALLAERGVIVSVNTSSNFRLRSGIAPIAAFLKAGLRFGIGLDGNAMDDEDDILREMRLLWFNHRGFGLDDVLSAEHLFRAMLLDGRRAVLGEDGGGLLEAGRPADILVLDHAAMTGDFLSPQADPTMTVLTRATRQHIARLMVAGRTIVEHGRCISVDKPALEAELLGQARAAWAHGPPREDAMAHTRHAVRRFFGCGCHFGQALRAE